MSNPSREQLLREFVGAGLSGWFYVGAVIFALDVVVIILGAIRGNFEINEILMVFIGLAVGGGVAIYQYRKYQKNKAEWEAAESRGDISRWVDEFVTAQDTTNDDLRFGDTVLFVRKHGVPIPYTSIDRVYQYVHKTNFVENQRMLQARLRDGTVVNLCKLELRGKDDTLTRQLMLELVKHNPAIQLGYSPV